MKRWRLATVVAGTGCPRWARQDPRRRPARPAIGSQANVSRPRPQGGPGRCELLSRCARKSAMAREAPLVWLCDSRSFGPSAATGKPCCSGRRHQGGVGVPGARMRPADSSSLRGCGPRRVCERHARGRLTASRSLRTCVCGLASRPVRDAPLTRPTPPPAARRSVRRKSNVARRDTQRPEARVTGAGRVERARNTYTAQRRLARALRPMMRLARRLELNQPCE
jgi:hypothetical protein